MKKSISKNKLREFALLIGFGFPIILGLIIPLLSGHQFRIWTLWVSIATLLIGFLKPLLLYYPYKLWMAIGYILGFINSRLILGIIFIFMVQPISFTMKIFGYDPLRLKTNNQRSYRENKKNYKINLNNIF
tara:strand:- start:434 stop:826 length:393 start_codon:yes stop_codon:yes gene_type:complete